MAKITDSELIQAIWECQVYFGCNQVISRYIGGTYGLEDKDTQWNIYTFNIHQVERALITSVIGEQQILKRLRGLVLSGLVDNQDRCTFSLMTSTTELAFDSAHEFWESKGIPKGFDQENKRCRSIRCDNFWELLEECRKFVISKHPKPDLPI